MSARAAQRRRGFTLLEVMIAMAILAGALTWDDRRRVAQHQGGEPRQADDHRHLPRALRRWSTSRTSSTEKGFGEFEKEQAGQFDDKGFSRFSWKAIVDKVELPSPSSCRRCCRTRSRRGRRSRVAAAIRGCSRQAGSMRRGRRSSNPLTAGASAISSQFGVIKDVLEQAIRRVTIKIGWIEGQTPQEVQLVHLLRRPSAASTRRSRSATPRRRGRAAPARAAVVAAAASKG